jgi:putative membrane-bound dehydrogenase-like protein
MSRLSSPRVLLLFLAIGLLADSPAESQDKFIPRKQTQPPGPPLSPEAALAKMTVPEGFHVELVASEPDLLNPVAMAFDDAGRIYVTESFEYPRHEPGPGRDRIKILADTDQDGRVDSVKIFAEGLNIPSGIAVGYGGVWVANAPDLLFLQDTDGDDRADKQTVVATGFGRDDTHELPNALTWGPDGYLYGLNGVFNRSVVKQEGKTFDFTCALFRVDPITMRFELFCEGTSNPWGVAFDDQGSAFISACVIDHLWHLTESGYYHRQGGPYPPHTWKIESIVDYQHQMAAYCGIEYFDSPAYPEEYRRKLYMGNIHGGCINVDSVRRSGSTYKGTAHPDFLTAHDVWFMPVAQKVGPDGCLYVLDWYDRYHCYQDASADPEGVDRGHGRLYRIVYDRRPTSPVTDLNQLADDALLPLLTDPNIFFRQRAAVVLSQRLRSEPQSARNRELFRQLLSLLNSAKATEHDSSTSPSTLHLALTTFHAPQMTAEVLAPFLHGDDPLRVSWAIQAAATRKILSPSVTRSIAEQARHADPRVRLQVAIAAGKIAGTSSTQWIIDVLDHSEDDGLLPRIAWKNMLPRMIEDQDVILEQLIPTRHRSDSLLLQMAPRLAARILADVRPDLSGLTDEQSLRSALRISSLLHETRPQQAAEILQAIVDKFQTGELRASAAKQVLVDWQATAGITSMETLQLRGITGDEQAIDKIIQQMNNVALTPAQRIRLLQTLASIPPESRELALTNALAQWMEDVQQQRDVASPWRDALLETIIQKGSDPLRLQLAKKIASLPTSQQATIAERMCQRDSTAVMLLNEIQAKKLSPDIVSPNQIRALAKDRPQSIQSLVQSIWGTVRTEDSKERQPIVKEMSEYLHGEARGNAQRGLAVFDRICGQCHQMHDRGFEVGPNISRNGRGSFEQLVISVFDPSLVIGDAYKSVTVLTDDGRVLNGIVTEHTEQRIVLKIQGGKSEIVPMEIVDELRQNPQSLMPEGLEQQMTRAEMADLFALLSLENPIDAKENATIAGTPAQLHQD